jgi:hypothetical protein
MSLDAQVESLAAKGDMADISAITFLPILRPESGPRLVPQQA